MLVAHRRCAMDSLLTSKMPSDNSPYPTQPEKPHHYTYLKEFRTQQCPLFLQHKCTQHRPFTCFHWHFLNQRRRRPIRKRDGTFNYSPDIYCTKYDETTGICEEGDDCPYLHRTAGDTERRYHLRYYKTGTCVHETDSKGHCVKNGPHCAFAHGVHDLRTPVYDIREITGSDVSDKGPLEATATTQLEKDRMVNEDPKWNDTNYVLANYKTEPCKRPPRLCRQGYACPSYHNNRDRRRSPKKYKYRSTPCPNVKHGDDWGDPAQCDNGDACSYCHTRTEQQFHPEIYKSTKCNDMVQTSYCPRGPFCAFAHVEQEMTTQRELGSPPDNSLAAFVSNALPEDEKNIKENGDHKKDVTTNGNITPTLLSPRGKNMDSSLPEPIGKGRSNSMSGSQGGSISGSLPNSDHFSSHYRSMAPGSEREEHHHLKLNQQLMAIDSDHNLDINEKMKRKQSLLLMHGIHIGSPGSASMIMGLSPATSAMSPLAPSFYPPGDTVESVIGNALDEDLNLGELSSSLDREFANDKDMNDSNAVSSSYGYFGPTSLPVTIPSRVNNTSLVASLSHSPVSSPLGSLPNSYLSHPLNDQAKQEQQLQGAAAAFLSQPNPGKYSAPGYSEFASSMSPRNSISQAPLVTSPFSNGNISNGINGFSEVQRLRDELTQNKAKMSQWEERISQARAACEAWRKEAEDTAKKYSEDNKKYVTQRDEALEQVSKLKHEIEHLRGGPFIHCLQRVSDLETLPLPLLRQMQTQLRMDLETLDKAISQSSQSRPMKCVVCGDQGKNGIASTCNHCVMCESCANKGHHCPVCQGHISQPSNFLLSM